MPQVDANVSERSSSQLRVRTFAGVAVLLAAASASHEASAETRPPKIITIQKQTPAAAWTVAPLERGALSRSEGIKIDLQAPAGCWIDVKLGSDPPKRLTSQSGSQFELSYTPDELNKTTIEDLEISAGCIGQAAAKIFAGSFAQIPPPPPAPAPGKDASSSCDETMIGPSIGPLFICPALLEQTGMRDDGMGDVPAVVAELFQILAEIAVEKAKRKGFELIRRRIEDTLCTIVDPTGKQVLKRTCAAVAAIRLNDLATQAQALQGALVADLLSLVITLKNQMAVQDAKDNANVSALLELIVSTLKVNVQGGRLRVTLPEPKLLLDQIVAAEWSFSAKDGMKAVFDAAVAVTRQCLVKSDLRDCDLSQIVVDLNLVLTPDQRARAVTMARLLVDASVAANASSGIRERFRLALNVAIDVVQMAGVEEDLCDKLRGLFTSVVDNDLATAIAAGTGLITMILPATTEGSTVKKVLRVITTIGAYAATYQKTDNQAATDEKKLHEARKRLIEDLIDEMTDRRGRETDGIWSLGINASLVAGLQSIRGRDGGLEEPTGMFPQVSLPLGLSFDKGTSKHCGFHLMLYSFDLGQFAAYSGEEGINKPRWDSFLTAGGQVGFFFGHETPFVLAADVRYSPTLFSQTSEGDLTEKRGGALRFGVSAGYYVPFLDFN